LFYCNCVRYTKGLEVFERFLGFIDVSEKQDSETLVQTIFTFLDKLNLKDIPILAQSYDGTSVMSGKRNGVPAKLQTQHPQAIYTHCMAHRVNLVVVDMCKNIEVYFSTYHYCNCGITSNTFIIFSMQNISLTLLSHCTFTSLDLHPIKS